MLGRRIQLNGWPLRWMTAQKEEEEEKKRRLIIHAFLSLFFK